MADTPTRQHVLSDELIRYFEGELDERREEAITEHLENCDECGERALEVGKTIAAMKCWTPEAHGDAYRAHLHEVVERALGRAAEVEERAEVTERLRRWLERGKRQAEAAVGVYIDAERGEQAVSSDGLETLVRPEATLTHVPTEPPTPTGPGEPARLSEISEDGAVHLVRISETEGPVLQARRDLRGAEKLPAAGIRVSVEEPGSTASWVEDGGQVVVELSPLVGGGEAPLVLLVDSLDRYEPVVEEPGQGRHGLEARFRGVKPGNYVVLIEPLSAI